MTVAFNKFNSFVEALAEGKHDFSTDTLEIALCPASNPPLAGNSVLADLTQIAYTNLQADRTLSVSGHAQIAGTLSIVVANKTLLASGNVAAFRYVVVFNQSAPNDELICWYDYGSALSLIVDEIFSIDFGSALLTLV